MWPGERGAATRDVGSTAQPMKLRASRPPVHSADVSEAELTVYVRIIETKGTPIYSGVGSHGPARDRRGPVIPWPEPHAG
jgi:hypothetical protein